MDDFKPTTALALFALLGKATFTELDKADHYAFADAGPDARIAHIGGALHGDICELLDLRADFEGGLMAIIGGDSLQLELHGVTTDGEPIAWCLPLNPFEQ